MSNTQRLGTLWKGRAWDDGEQIPRTTLPDGTMAEAMASMGYGWNATASAFQKLTVDNTTGGLNVGIAADAIGLAKDSSLTAIFGSPGDTTAAYTVLNELQRLRKAEESNSKTLQALLAVMSPVVARKTQTTLLHRS